MYNTFLMAAEKFRLKIGDPDLRYRKRETPEDAYRAYLNGGNTIPQKRMGINISLLRWLAESHDGDAFDQIGLSHLSINQKRQSAKAMVSLHKLAGVQIPGIPREQQSLPANQIVDLLDLSFAESEWMKAIGGLYKSFFQLMMGEPVQVEKVTQLVNEENHELIKQWLKDETNKPVMLDAFTMARKAWKVLSEEVESLVYLHRISVFGKEKMLEYFRSQQEKFEKVIAQFGIKSDLEDTVGFTNELASKIKEVLFDELGPLSDQISPEWVVWGI